LVALQLGLQVFAAFDLARRRWVRGGNRWVWAVIILLGLLGALAYFALGRLDEVGGDVDGG
jgi:hypothetical protein